MEHTTQPNLLQTPLTDLKGIGPAKASRIRAALNIEFAEDLVGLNADDIFHKLAENGPQIPRREIQQWLIQALRLDKAHAAEAAATTADSPAAATTEGHAALGNQPQGSDPVTGRFEVSRVGNQLRVSHANEGPLPRELTTADPQHLYQWLQAKLTPDPSEAGAPGAAPLPQWRIDITRVEVVPLAWPQPSQPPQPQTHLPKDVPFTIGVNFQVTGTGDGPQPAPMTAIAQFSMRNRLTGETVQLGTAQGAILQPDAARLQSPPATLAKPGIYQLQAVITLEGYEAVAGYRELQLVKVL